MGYFRQTFVSELKWLDDKHYTSSGISAGVIEEKIGQQLKPLKWEALASHFFSGLLSRPSQFPASPP